MKKIRYFISVIVMMAIASYANAYEVNPGAIAMKFLNSLDAGQKEKVHMAFDDESRSQWHFLPISSWPRMGLPMKALNKSQRQLIHELLQVYLSSKGYNKTLNIIALEEVLAVLEKNPVRRDPELYYVAFYGDPSKDDPWGWSFEGHHVSLNFTVVGAKISYTPRFFGANPAIVKEGPKKGTRALKNEEDLGLKLINMLNPEQKKIAIFRLEAFLEVVTSNASQVTPLDEVGIPAGDMTTAQQQTLFDLIDEYLSAMPEVVAKKRMSKLREEEIQNIRFGWAGQTQIDKPHYYRVQGKTFLIEFDNTQNNANHIHAVWRDFDGDFGRDLIKEHYQRSAHD
ncbi:DUF3500 domain-containing protein [Fulvivirgaceae bacterium BMA12]|uniref:DUF3500 domain-containing protein n=1 Tax=Agaribacillus aureus TaxID=3051825 RepID=A0ABT8LFN1_9BACT|nr:DUF3500 domain-containing protein [Fulvivirgaceae bacterium BMA12]